MSITVQGNVIREVFVIDDDEEVRATYADGISDQEVEIIEKTSFEEPISTFIESIRDKGIAVLCDYRLKSSGWASFNGDELAVALYKCNVPVILCTNYGGVKYDIRKSYRRYIPAIVNSITEIAFTQGVSVSIAERNGIYTNDRLPVTSALRIVELDVTSNDAYVVIPNWDNDEKIKLGMDEFPEAMKPLLREDFHFIADVNIGTSDHRDLFIVNHRLEITP